MGSTESRVRGKQINPSDLRWLSRSTKGVHIQNCWSEEWALLISELAELKSLRDLSIDCCVLPASVLELIGQKLPLLELLSFRDNKTNGTGMTSLQHLRNLTSLNLGNGVLMQTSQ